MIFLDSFFYFYCSMSNSFGKNNRLKGKKVVSRIFEGPKKTVSSFPFRAFYSITSVKLGLVKFGASVSKKKFKRAVDRNKIKRLIKEAVRLNNSTFISRASNLNVEIHVMILFNGDKIPSYNLVEVKIKEILNRLEIDVQSYEKS